MLTKDMIGCSVIITTATGITLTAAIATGTDVNPALAIYSYCLSGISIFWAGYLACSMEYQ